MTTVPGSSSGTSTCSTYAAKASPSIAPLLSQGAISAPAPAMNVCIPHDPNVASMTSRSPRCDHPRRRVRLVVTEVSSMKTKRSGRADTASCRCLIQSSRRFLTFARLRSVATNVFFCREADLAQEPASRVWMRLNTGRIRQRTGEFGHGQVAVLINQVDQNRTMRLKPALPARATLRRGSGMSGLPDRKTPTRRCDGRKLQAQGCRAPARTFFHQLLKPRPQRIRQRC